MRRLLPAETKLRVPRVLPQDKVVRCAKILRVQITTAQFCRVQLFWWISRAYRSDSLEGHSFAVTVIAKLSVDYTRQNSTAVGNTNKTKTYFDIFIIVRGIRTIYIESDQSSLNCILKRVYFEGTIYEIRGLVLMGGETQSKAKQCFS